MSTNTLPIEILEMIFVVLTVIIQVMMFLRTRAKIRLFRNIVPEEEHFQMVEAHIPTEVLQQKEPKDIIANIGHFVPAFRKAEPIIEEPPVEKQETNSTEVETSTALVKEEITKLPPPVLPKKIELVPPKDVLVEVPIIQVLHEKEVIFDKILLSINTYLLRNKGAVTDFSLVKDIVERHVEAVDNDIRITLPIPLYLGLMMTMFGIVIGLFWMPDLTIDLNNVGESLQFSDGINVLLGGVRIAMIASFTGLLLTTINSGFLYNGSKTTVEGRKNDFYTFLQTELLPILSQNVTSSMHALQVNFMHFNQEFSKNVQQLGHVMGQNYEALAIQDRILNRLENSDFTQLVKANIVIFDKVSQSVAQLEKSSDALSDFQNYLLGLQGFVKDTRVLNSRISEILTRTDNFKAIAYKIRENLNETTKLQQFLNSHFSELESRKQLINNAVASVDDILDKSLDDLKAHTKEKMNEIRELSVKQQDLTESILKENAFQTKKFFADLQANMGTVVEENQTAFHQLGHLKDLSKNFSRFIEIEQKRSVELTKAMRDLRSSQQQTLARMDDGSFWNKVGQMIYWSFQILAIIFFVMMMFYFAVNGF